jgi:preprotein translocase subunit SecA
MLQKLLLLQRLRHSLEVSKDVPKDLRNEAQEVINADLLPQPRQVITGLMARASLPTDGLKDTALLQWAMDQWKLPAENLSNLEEALKHGIPHNILNAKFHEREALIIAEAGRKGQVTIATNMAGRGVDILLGGRIQDELVERAMAMDENEYDEYTGTYVSYRRGGQERAAPPLPLDDQERIALAEEVRVLGGMYILGTERHESRRIDNQLRGRAGRQGDPGESKFYVALEDQLWKIFNANMLENPLLRAWPPMEQVDTKFLSRMIEKTQERIENHFFEARKHVLEYDDVLNAQREHIYAWRREILLGEKDVRTDLKGQIDELVADVCENAWMIDEKEGRIFDYEVLYEDLAEYFPVIDYCTLADLEAHKPGEDLIAFVQDIAHQAYDAKLEGYGDELMKVLEQHVALRAVNDKWQDHLQVTEYIREGIGLRSYGQVDPLVAYKRETYDMFQNTLKGIRDQAVRMIFRAEISQPQTAPPPAMMRMEDEDMDNAALEMTTDATSAVSPVVTVGQPNGYLGDIDWKRVGRNDACPCGSGKKFKACHYPSLRSEGVI